MLHKPNILKDAMLKYNYRTGASRRNKEELKMDRMQ